MHEKGGDVQVYLQRDLLFYAESMARAILMSRERSVLRMIAWRRLRRKPAHEQEAKRIANDRMA